MADVTTERTYLDKDGVIYLWDKIKGQFVSKDGTKVLSTNDYTTDEKTKLAGIATGAEVNKIDSITINGGAKQTIAEKNVDIKVPTKTSDITNDSNFAVDANYVHTDSNYTADEKTKLGGIDAGAEVNVVETIKVNGTAVAVDEKAVNISVPTNNNQLANGAGYQTATEVQSAINDAVGKITGISFEVVTELPTTGEAGKIYLMAHSHSDTGDNYDEYVWIAGDDNTGKFEKIGNTDVDLSGYVKGDDLVRIENTEIDTITK